MKYLELRSTFVSLVLITIVFVIFTYQTFLKTNRTLDRPTTMNVTDKKFDARSIDLLQRNENRLRAWQRYYSNLLNVDAFTQPNSDQTMIYSCQKPCNGWGDRLRGIMSVYILALVTQRKFMIELTKPCSISTALRPNLVDWTYVQSPNSLQKNRTRLTIHTGVYVRGVKRKFLNTISKSDFVSMWKSYDDIQITTAEFFIAEIFQNPMVNTSWILKRLPATLATDQHLFAFLFEILFRPTKAIVQGVERTLRRPYKELICFHVRMGRNPTIPIDGRFPQRANLSYKMVNFFREKRDFTTLNDSLIFITSDSEQAIDEIQQYFPHNSVTVPGPIIHVEFILYQRPTRDRKASRCSGWIKMIIEFFILSECDVSILSDSGFSRWPTHRRYYPIRDAFVYDDDLDQFKPFFPYVIQTRTVKFD